MIQFHQEASNGGGARDMLSLPRMKQDISEFLNPIQGDSICGADLLYDDSYNAIRLAREVDDDVLPLGVWTRDTKRLDWRVIAKDCEELLLTRTKDLQIAAWLAEAWAMEDGVSGLSRGVSIFVEMQLVFWDEVHPKLESSDPSMRLRPTAWLLRMLEAWISLHTIKDSEYDDGLEVGRLRSYEHWIAVRDNLERLESWIATRIDEDVPAFGRTIGLVEEVCKKFERNSIFPQSKTEENAAPQDTDSLVGQGSDHELVTTRESAYRRLCEIATLLQRVEPHSPVPLILHAIAEWRDLTFSELLALLPQQGPTVYELARLFEARQKKEA